MSQENSAVLAAAGRKAGAPTAAWSPMEVIPTLAVGESQDILPGATFAGVFLRTERICSDKFTNSQEVDPATGKKVQYRHVLRNGDMTYAVWNTGELALAFEKIPPNTYVEITYKGKGTVNGRSQHEFAYAVGQQA
jgi:hypothetical protein